ncbi:MAG: hypothetical protein IKN93_02555 [Bacteroidales bacterium]|nr:hypothetical protein [Bacteroidales bacterium]
MKTRSIRDIIAGCLLAVSIVLALMSSLGSYPARRSEVTARRIERKVNRRMAKLDAYVARAFEVPRDEWMELKGLPEDMVIYRYVNDSLQSWCNRFPVMNDDIQAGMVLDAITNPRSPGKSPLAGIGDGIGFYNLGPKWYLAKAVDSLNVRIVAGLEIVNTNSDVVRPYTVQPISYSEGNVICIKGEPKFKIVYESASSGISVNSGLLLVALILIALSGFVFLFTKPTLDRFWGAFIPILPLMTALQFWGREIGNDVPLFSPTVYADSGAFYSLGAQLNYLVAILLSVSFLYIVRRDVFRRLRTRKLRVLWSVFISVAIIGVIAYTVTALRSIVLNSNISLELYKLETFSVVSVVIIFSYILLLTAVLMLLQMLTPLVSRRPSIRILLSLAGSLLFVYMTASLGLKKEEASLEVWARRLAVSRDISLEMRLRSVEDRIAADPIIASLSVLENGGASISNRLEESYMRRIMQNYDVTVSLRPEDMAVMNSAEPISPDSRFSFVDAGNGFVRYVGMFIYRINNYGLSRVLISVEQKTDWRYSGYASIIGPTLPGEVMIPANYSFARYDDGRLLTFKGSYAYSVKMPASWSPSFARMQRNGWLHFIYKVTSSETVVISRPVIKWANYVISIIFIGLLCFVFFTLVSMRKARRRAFGETYFQTRIRLVVLTSLVATLVAMAVTSVAVVFNRNEVNRNTLMSEKINSIQASISARVKGVKSARELRTPEMMHLIGDVGNNTNSDITIYTPEGMVLLSTAPDVFYQMIVEPRMDSEAYVSIVRNTSRYFIHKERIGRHSFYSMYAPLMADDGSVLAIISSPYTDASYDFESYVLSHSLMIISLFIFLLLVATFMVSRVLALMFKPLVEMGTKMNAAGEGELETIEYHNTDEISGLVNAYNRMVTELKESTRKLAQAERDKAWSGMARQVAHEIKNPLTPMKLQIQRLIRLKNKGDDSWQDKFDEISRILLDHIDILTDTANEFSTFAKLYTQEPDEINLSGMLQEEISIFDNRGDIKFEYIGLEGVFVMGPKPQLTRVFVNLINNSVQAMTEHGEKDGIVRISLRNSITEGFYDIVFEDSGPGVAEENVDKLFTPNFTTKNGGSGLGLAISRSVLERCGASISYSRSFALGGACFTILYPKG